MKNLLCFLILISLFSCKDDTVSKAPVIWVGPSGLTVYGKEGDVMGFNVSVYSDVPLSHFHISSKMDNSFQQTELDSALISSKQFSMLYQYKVPVGIAGKGISFTFTINDINGEQSIDLKKLIVVADTTLLTETTGHQMYSGKSINANAYNLKTNTAQFSNLSDSTMRDIQDYPTTPNTDSTLSLSWISPAGGKFVLFNGYDYPNANLASAINAYNSGLKSDQINNLKIGDILITKLGSGAEEKYVVIKLTDIKDNKGNEDDFYIFSIKKKL